MSPDVGKTRTRSLSSFANRIHHSLLTASIPNTQLVAHSTLRHRPMSSFCCCCRWPAIWAADFGARCYLSQLSMEYMSLEFTFRASSWRKFSLCRRRLFVFSSGESVGCVSCLVVFCWVVFWLCSGSYLVCFGLDKIPSRPTEQVSEWTNRIACWNCIGMRFQFWSDRRLAIAIGQRIPTCGNQFKPSHNRITVHWNLTRNSNAFYRNTTVTQLTRSNQSTREHRPNGFCVVLAKNFPKTYLLLLLLLASLDLSQRLDSSRLNGDLAPMPRRLQ